MADIDESVKDERRKKSGFFFVPLCFDPFPTSWMNRHSGWSFLMATALTRISDVLSPDLLDLRMGMTTGGWVVLV